MDLLNLSCDLPQTRPVGLVSVEKVNREITTEFKNAAKSVAALYNSATTSAAEQKAEFANAAKSVASLYRMSTSSHTLLVKRGYLECLDELLDHIARGEDIENWALTKRAELTNTNADADPEPAASSPASPSSPLVLPEEYEFTIASDIVPGCKFRPSFPPLSVRGDKKGRDKPERRDRSKDKPERKDRPEIKERSLDIEQETDRKRSKHSDAEVKRRKVDL